MLFSVIVENEAPALKQFDIDEEWIVQIGQGNKEAFVNLYQKTERAVYAYVLAIVRNHEDAQDITHDTYLKIRASAHLYKAMGKPMAWIYTIAGNLAKSSFRYKNRIDSVQVTDMENDQAFSYVTNADDRLVLESLLEYLNEEERIIILSHVVTGMRHAEIAGNLQIPLSTVLSKYHRGLKKLKKHLLEQGVEAK